MIFFLLLNIDQINQAAGRANALKTEAQGKAEALTIVAEQIKKGKEFSRNNFIKT